MNIELSQTVDITGQDLTCSYLCSDLAWPVLRSVLSRAVLFPSVLQTNCLSET